MKSSKFVLACTFTFLLGLSLNNFAVSDVPVNYKVAVVDVQKIVSSSSQVNILKEDQKKKKADLTAFIQNAKKEISQESDAVKRKSLEEKYLKEFNAKRIVIEDDYEKKLTEIDKSISDVISVKAKEKNYDLVLAKGVVLFGGDDITNDVAKSVK